MSSLIPQSNRSLSTSAAPDPSAEAPTAVSHLPKIDFGEIVRAIRRRLWIVFVFVALALMGALYYVNKLPVLYTSQGSLFVKTRAPQIFQKNPLSGEESNNLEAMKTVEQGLLSSSVLLRVAEINNLASDPDYSANGTDQQSMLSTMQERIRIELRKGTRLIDVQVEDTDPHRASLLVEDIVREYESWKEGGRSDLIAKASVGLASEEERLRKKMEASESRLSEFRENYPVLGLTGDQQRIFSTELENLNRERSAATVERLRIESQYRGLGTNTAEAKGTANLAARGVRGSLAIDLERQIAAKKSEFAVLKERYGPKHPLHIEAVNELSRLEESLAQVVTDAEKALELELAEVRSREQELTEMVAESKKRALNDEQLRDQYSFLTREAEIDRNLHSQVATRLEETQIGAAFSTSFLSWEERPFPASQPSSPNKPIFLAAGLFLGGLLGVFLALFLELLDPKVREASAVERKLRLPLLAKLPAYTRGVVSDLSVQAVDPQLLNRPSHLTRYTFSPRDESEQMETLMFASPFDGDGKSFCALKCARTLVRQGFRTLLIDADFTVSGLSRSYSHEQVERHGLSAYLTGEAEAAGVLFETGLSGLWFMPTGNIEDDNGDLLASPAFRRLLEAVEPMFDRVIIDVASVLESDDVQAVARSVNSTYLVAQKGKGKYRHLQEASEVLRSSGASLTGFIWNEGGRRKRRGEQGPVIEPMSYPQEDEPSPETGTLEVMPNVERALNQG